MSIRKWLAEQIGEAIIAALLALLGGAMLTLLKFHQSEWASPLLYGIAGFALIWMAGFVTIAAYRIPKLRTKVTVGNIEKNVRDWLDKSGSAVKTELMPETFFRFSVQLLGGTNVIVARSRTWIPEHVVIMSTILDGKNIPTELQQATVEDQQRLLELIRLELARAKVGYSGLNIPATEPFWISKNVRITDHLTEEEFMRSIWDVEAATHVTLSTYKLWLGGIAKTKAVSK